MNLTGNNGVHGGDLVLEALIAAGVNVVFGVPGGHSIPVYDALSRCRKIRHVLGRHEQGLVYMADGYSRASGRTGVVLTTSGPAVMNAAAAMGGATTDGAAVLVIGSAPRSELIGRNRGGLHDLNDAMEIVRPLCRTVARCERTEDIPTVISGLIGSLQNGRPGSAFCDIPADVYSGRIERSVGDHCSRNTYRPKAISVTSQLAVYSTQIKRAARMLSSAKRTFIIAGVGALQSGAARELDRVAELTGAVVTTTSLARGLFARHHPAHVFRDGGLWKPLDVLISEADVVLAVGTMFKQEDTADWTIKPGQRLIHIDIDPEEIGRSYPAEIGIAADAKEALRAILDELDHGYPADPTWRKRAKEAQERYLKARRRQNPVGFSAMDALRQTLPDNTILVADRCNLGYWLWRCYPTDYPRSFQYPLGYGGIGGALPQAIGATIGAPDRPVVCVIGDGGIHFTLGELSVAKQESAKFPIILCNNNRYGAIEAAMVRTYGHNKLGCSLWNPDFSKIAEAYGMEYRKADTVRALGTALGAALATKRLGMIEFTVDLADPPPDVDIS